VGLRTSTLLRALGHEHRLLVLAELADGSGATRAQLVERLKIPGVAVSKALTDLERLGLLERPASNRGLWHCATREPTCALLAAAARQAIAMGAPQDADRALADRFCGPDNG
jgi:DNA-binding transcriptional ArsR family regulator